MSTRTKPKRYIRKTVTSNTFTVSNAAASQTLATTQNKETLVRIVGAIDLVPNADDTYIGNILIKLNPSGTELFTIVAGALSLTDKDAKGVLWGGPILFTTHAKERRVFNIDVQGMRKLDPNDTITLNYIHGTAAQTITGRWFLTMFYKET
jgi:hypothetical protein